MSLKKIFSGSMSTMRQNKWWIVLAIFLFELPAGVDAQNAKA